MLDFLGPLCNRGGEILRKHIIEVLLTLDWGEHAVLMANSLVECCISEDDSNAAISKIEGFINLSLQNLRRSWRDASESLFAKVEEVPQLLHQLTLLGYKIYTGLSADLASRIVEIISMAIDSLFTCYFDKKNKFPEISKIQNVCYVIFESMAIAFAKDQSLCHQVIYMLKRRCLCSSSKMFIEYMQSEFRQHSGSSSIVSVGKLSLFFVVGRSPREASKVSSELFGLIYEIYDSENHMNNSLWFQSQAWKYSNEHMTYDSLKEAFELLFAGPLMFQGIVTPVIHMAFTLVDAYKLPIPSSWGKISSSKVSCIRVSPFNQIGVEEFGKWIILKLFCEYDDDSRKKIIGEIILRLASMSSISPFESSTRTNSKSVITSHCVDALKKCIECCDTHHISKLSVELQEVFLYLTELTPDNAKSLINCFFPLFSIFPEMGDRCSVSLRKACFSRNSDSRQAAASSMLALLRCHLQISLGTRSSSSQVYADYFNRSRNFRVHMKDKVLPGLSVEQIMALLKRFLQYQSSVRSLLYEELCEISAEISDFRPFALRLLRIHFLGLFIKDEESTYHRKNHFDSSSLPPYMKLDVDRCIDEFGSPQENFKDLVATILCIIQMDSSQDLIIDLFSFFSQGTLVESMSFSQNEFHVQSREGQFCCDVLWTFVNSMIALDVETVCSVVPRSQLDLGKLDVLFTAYYSSMIVTMTLPIESKSDDVRRSLLDSILQKVKVCVNLKGKFLKSKREKFSKVNKSSRSSISNVTDDENVQISANTQSNTSNKGKCIDNSKFITSDTGVGEFTMLAEMKFLSKLLNLISLLDVDDVEIDSQFETRKADSLNSDFLGGLLLERVVICLERAIANFQESNVTKEFHSTIFRILCSLYPSLLRYIMLIQKGIIVDDDRRNNPLTFLSSPALNSASLTHLILRGLLGCVKIISLSRQDIQNTGTIMAHIIHMIDTHNLNSKSADGGMSYMDPMGMSDMSANLLSSVAFVEKIEEAILNNLELLIALQNERNRDVDRQDASLLVALIGEFFSCIGIFRDKNTSARDPRSSIADKITQKCDKYLHQPSAMLTSSLIQFLIFQAPVNPVDRLNKSSTVSCCIEECIRNKEAQIDDWIDKNGSEFGDCIDFRLVPQHFTILSLETLSIAVSTLMVILDKALNEAFALSRIFQQRNARIEDTYRAKTDMTVLYPVMKRFAEIISPLFSVSIGFASLEKLFTFTIRYYKLLVVIMNELLSRERNVLAVPLKELITTVSQALSPNIYNYLNAVEQNEQKLKLCSASSKRKREESKSSATKLDTIVPGLIFQLEQFDVSLIKLSSCAIAENTYLTKLIKRSNIRDFRLKLGSAKNG